MPSIPDEHDTGLAPEAIAAERPHAVETPWGTMALYRLSDQIVCAQAFCPHLGGPLFQGTLSGDTLTCPWHQWRYDLRSGVRVDPPAQPQDPESRPLERCEVQLSERGTLLLRRPLAVR